MRRWAVGAIVLLLVMTMAVTSAGASTAGSPSGGSSAATSAGGSSAAGSSEDGTTVHSGSVWTLMTGGVCEVVSFGTGHAFSALRSSSSETGSGDEGTYSRGKKLKMRWTSGPSSGSTFLGRYRRSDKAYVGTSTLSGVSADANLDPASVVGCAVVTAVLGSPSISFGSSDNLTVTVSGTGGVTPTGWVGFWVCPGDSNPCLSDSPGSVDLGTETLTGSGDSVTASTDFIPSATGTYCLGDVYIGDNHYASAADDTDLCFTVAATGTTVTTSPLASIIPLGASITDGATVTSTVGRVEPTGTVTFYACGPETSPTTCTTSTGTQIGSPVAVTVVAGTTPPAVVTATSPAFTPTSDGTYCFLGVYSGDGNYTSSSDGSSTDQCFTVRGPGPVITTAPTTSSIVLGASDTDTATVTGEGDLTPTGDVHFYACPASDETCSTTALDTVDLGTAPLSGSGDSATATSAAFTPADLGNYCFAAIYSGDANYPPASGTSDGECFTVTSATPALVGLGSPENSFGTGDLPLGADGTAEETPTGIWAAASGYCTSKENGDEYLSAFDATYTGSSTWLCSATPTSEDPHATTNYEYNGNDGSGYSYEGGYSYDVVTPPTDTGVTADPITVEAYDPAFEISPCTGSGALGSPDGNNGGPTSDITTAYDLTYSPVPINPGQDVAVPGLVVGPTSAPPIVAGTTNQYVAASGDQTTCGLWATLFTIPAGSNDGDYRLDVSTPQTFSPMQNSDGSNVYALRVYEGTGTIPPTEPNLAGPWTRCSTITTDAWYSPTCPIIQGQNALSVYVNQSENTGSFYLAQIPASDAGQVLSVHLFDPGEGDHYVELLDPDDPAQPVDFSWETTDDCPLAAPNEDSTDCAEDIGPGVFHHLSGAGSMLDVSRTLTPPPGEGSDSLFNDRELELTFTIPADYAASDGGWWKIQYLSGTGAVSDRTTWTVSVGGSSAGTIASAGTDASSARRLGTSKRVATSRKSGWRRGTDSSPRMRRRDHRRSLL
jgi:hypothetical protein